MDNHNKLAYVKELCKNLQITLSEVAYIGDDVNDKELLKKVGYPACPNDAHKSITEIPNIKKMSLNGGSGAVREFIDCLLENNCK